MVAFWLVVAAVMAVMEAVTCGLVTVWFVVGALVAFLLAWFQAPLVVQVFVFALVSVACLVCLRPFALGHRNTGDSAEPTAIGKTGVVIVEPEDTGGLYRVRLADGMDWAARSEDGSRLICGEIVKVVGQESTVLVVAGERPNPVEGL